MATSLTNDIHLVRQIRKGKKDAFDYVYKLHWLRLYRVACRIVEDENNAKDIVQDTFVSLWEKGCHKDILNLEAYLYQSVKFRCFMHLRSGAISEKHLARFASLTESVVVDNYDLKEMETLLGEGLTTLPDRCREVFVLSRFEDLPNKEIARRLNISGKTVENQITKAIKHLRLSFDKMGILFVLIFF